MPKSQRRKDYRRKFKLNITLPNSFIVLLAFGFVFLYLTGEHILFAFIGGGLIICAGLYLNAFWYGNANILKQQFRHHYVDSNMRVLIINNNNIISLQKEIVRMQKMVNLSVVGTDFNQLKFQNETFDLVLVNDSFQSIRPRVKRIKAIQEAARVVNHAGQIVIIEKGFSINHYQSFLNRSGFRNVNAKYNGAQGWWSGPWWASFTVTGQKG